jgi:RNA-directed DNA polymerase
MKLMLRSYSNLLLSVSKVTQKNKGRKTPGIDGQVVLTPKARVRLVKQMANHQAWAASPGRRIYIPKAKGRRPLGILTVKNRVAQAIVKNALEPSWEARFEINSYGFRPGRSCHDAIKQCWLRLKRGRTHRWVLDADVRAAFDNISQCHILKRLGNVPGRELIRQWLAAGYVEAEIFHATTNGVQQGGVISPLIANVALDGLENILAPRAGYIRYADDLVVTARSREEIEALVPTVSEFLAERGLELNAEKTRIVHVKDGFNFLGFNVRSYQDKCIVKPQKDVRNNEIRPGLNKKFWPVAAAPAREISG